MTKQATLPLAEELARRNAEHEPMYSFVISESEAVELAAGRVPENVVRMAEWALEPVEVMLGRKRRAR